MISKKANINLTDPEWEELDRRRKKLKKLYGPKIYGDRARQLAHIIRESQGFYENPPPSASFPSNG